MKKFLIIAICILGLAGCSKITPGSNGSANGRYELFKTENMWTFLKLDTQTGQIWQVQASVKGENYRFETELSSVDLVNDHDYYNGRFSLYATGNMYNFVLLDKSNGRTWQVQWGDANSRMIVKIK